MAFVMNTADSIAHQVSILTTTMLLTCYTIRPRQSITHSKPPKEHMQLKNTPQLNAKQKTVDARRTPSKVHNFRQT
ncbi:hypothetical protein NADFUDRAFT_44982 [Nadsonia fulvescens var. elongata DSM 6958]|uniref:Uncharacterized protein n=1 Tax=Nadsonia fulvescens var. elongata DSM 6958 TaxID=857566 RepID=A0A1E3PSY9_9ASCO|nr:hypothetical protein NADFUDRAFT_44982 [Nadsonia fulvescens var. elongata DSM 6958]